MLEYVCVGRVSYKILSFGKLGTPKFGVDVKGYIAQHYMVSSWGMLP